MLGLIVVTGVINLFVGGRCPPSGPCSATVFVPMFMTIGISPELTQVTYRIGDSVTKQHHAAQPVRRRRVLVFMQATRQEGRTGYAHLGVMLPYAVVFAPSRGAVLLVVWIVLGVPLGPPGSAGVRPVAERAPDGASDQDAPLSAVQEHGRRAVVGQLARRRGARTEGLQPLEVPPRPARRRARGAPRQRAHLLPPGPASALHSPRSTTRFGGSGASARSSPGAEEGHVDVVAPARPAPPSARRGAPSRAAEGIEASGRRLRQDDAGARDAPRLAHGGGGRDPRRGGARGESRPQSNAPSANGSAQASACRTSSPASRPGPRRARSLASTPCAGIPARRSATAAGGPSPQPTSRRLSRLKGHDVSSEHPREARPVRVDDRCFVLHASGGGGRGRRGSRYAGRGPGPEGGDPLRNVAPYRRG